MPQSRRQFYPKAAAPKKRAKTENGKARFLSRARERDRAFARSRAIKIQDLAKMLVANDPELDLELRPVCQKFARLPFAYITDCCAGHVSSRSDGRGRHFSLKEVKPGQRIYCNGTEFEIVLNNSPVSEKFRAALAEIPKRLPFVFVAPGPEMCILSVTGSRSRVSKRQAAQIMKMNISFIQEFESLVDRFVAKYGVKVRL